MDRRKELRQQYMETKTQAGVYIVKNNINQKVLVATTTNLRTLNRIRVGLESGVYRNKLVQKELDEYGKDAFTIEVLETLEVKDDGYFDLNYELKLLEKKWLDKLQPFENRGYNVKKED